MKSLRFMTATDAPQGSGDPTPQTQPAQVGRKKTNTVTVTVGEGKDAKEYSQVYNREDFDSVDELLTALTDPEKAKWILQDLNYGHDLKVRAQIRAALLDQVAGPEKAIAKLAMDIFKARAASGKPISMEAATEKAKLLASE